MVASHTLLDLFGLEGLVLPVGFHACHAFDVTPTVAGPHLLDAVHGRILSLPIEFLVPFIELGVPLFAGSARSGRIHAAIRVNGRHTRPPRPVTFGMDPHWSVSLWHDGPAAAVQSARGACGNSPGSINVHRPRFWFDTVDRPVGWLLGLGLPVRASGLV